VASGRFEVVVEANETSVAPRPMVPAAPPDPALAVRRRTTSTVLLVAAAMLGAAVAASLWFRLPYYTLGPGSVRPTAPLIEIDGGSAFPPAEGVAFTTVSLDGRLTVWEALAAWLDPDVDVVSEDVVLQGRSPQESQQVNLQLMDDAKDTATQVALVELGLSSAAGAEVVDVVADSPAAAVLAAGDVVTAIDGQPVTSSSSLVQAIGARRPGDQVRLALQRRPSGDGTRESAEVNAVLAAADNQPAAPFFGVRVTTWYDVRYPHPIQIDSGDVVGPSAGLAFTLGLVDALTPGELAGAQEVAATGTIRPDGTVGPIGGLEYKVDAVRKAGVHLFLVPASQTPGELAEAERRARDDVEIVPVRTLDEALAALREHGGQEPAVPAR
jgi:PDZ domain-containing protein